MSIQKEVEAYFQSLPGKRGIDIPADAYDQIFNVANGITQKYWGRHPTPQQMQYLHDNGHHEPDAIHEMFDHQPHPHAPNMSLAEYPSWKQAYQSYSQHGKKQT